MPEENSVNKENKSKRTVMRSLCKSPLAMLGLFIVLLLIVCAIFADSIAPYSYSKQNLLHAFEFPSSKHLFGTDEFGRDIFSRMVYGSRISLVVGFIAVGIAIMFGGLLGAVAGYYGGVLDNLIMRAMDILLSIPSTVLAISIAAALGPGLLNLMVAVGISSTPAYARVMRGSVLMAPLIVQSTLGVASAILSTAGLSFIGLGIQPPTPEWGAMLSGARAYIRDYAYMTFFPGFAIMITILALNFLGDGLRDALDPKLKR